MKLIGWTHWMDDRFEEIEEDGVEYELAWELTVAHMKENGLQFQGPYHQNGALGTPCFDTGKKLALSLRGWGALMADVMDINNDYILPYTVWAWNWILPEDIKVKTPED